MDTLANHGIHLRREAVGTHKTTCPQCSHTRRDKRDPCLSVTIKAPGDAVWHCHHCDWAGGLKTETEQAPRRERKQYRKPAVPAEPPRTDKFLAWFEAQGIGKASVERAGIYQTTHKFSGDAPVPAIAFPYVWRGETYGIKYRTPDRGKGKKSAQEANAQPTLFGIHAADHSQPWVWTEGEMDVLACWEAGYTNAVTLRGGAKDTMEALEFHAEVLAKVPEFIIATDTDEPGNELAEKLAKRLGKHRCRRAVFGSGAKDPNDELIQRGDASLRACLEEAEPWPVDGVYRADEFSDDVWAEYYGLGRKPLSTGWDELDKYYRVFPGDFGVVTGVPNHGKSQWLFNLASNMSQKHGWKWAVFSPEHRPSQTIIRLAEIYLGMPFHDSEYKRRMGEGDLGRAIDWVNEHFYLIQADDTQSPTIDFILDGARGSAISYGINGLIIDPYNEIEHTRKSGQTETEFVSYMISQCKRFARNHEVSVWIVAHPMKMQTDAEGNDVVPSLYDIAGSAHWRNKADAGIAVHRDFDAAKTYIFTKKIREQPIAGKIGRVEFTFDPGTRQYTDTGASDAL